MQKSKPLIIYKASAGSGKTYTLALNYLMLLLEERGFGEDSYFGPPYRRILAVTFTNKATAEMKSRIIEALFELSSGNNDAAYSKELISLGCASDTLSLARKAKDALYTILNDYTNFNISTIDTFFQRTMRAFARDIGLQGGYSIEIDTDSITEEAIDRMYASLDSEDNRALSEWLLKFNDETINEGNKWNISESKIKELSKQLFKEGYKEWHNSVDYSLLPTKESISVYDKTLKEMLHRFESDLRTIHAEARRIIKDIPLEELYQKSRTPFGYLLNPIPNKIKPLPKSFRNLIEKKDKWITKDASAETCRAMGELSEGGYVERIVSLFDERYKSYATAYEISRSLYVFGIMSDIDDHIREIEKERNIMLLSDTTELLNKITDGSDTPFIYEKTGSYIKHYMIDEFQDTSRMQWRNFLPLILESLSSGGKNLIVGDVKQSIYRWRNSDWRLFNTMPDKDLPVASAEVEVCGLDVNWRSSRNIVEFNNIFFSEAAALLKAEIEDETLREEFSSAYRDVEQKLPRSKVREGGAVDITLFSNSASKSEFKERAVARLYKDISSFIKSGIKPSDIVILVRAKDDASFIAEELIRRQAGSEEGGFYVISDEALLISTSPIVRVLVAVLRYLAAPGSRTLEFAANYEYALLKGESPGKAIAELLSNPERSATFAQKIVGNTLLSLSSKPLFEICEEIINLSGNIVDPSQIPFIQAFQDTLLNYTKRYGSNIVSFIEWWDANSSSAVISSPSTQDAVRVMTIHKSKGLEFNTVLVPFCDWNMNIQDGTIAWEKPLTPGAPEWRVPLSVASRMLESEYSDIYTQEKMLSATDNLNIAYVAFTRAKDNLIIYTPEAPPLKTGKTTSSLGSFNKLLSAVLSRMENNNTALRKLDLTDSGEIIYKIGDIKLTHCSGSSTGETLPAYISVSPFDRLKMRLRGASYFDETSNRKYGNIMHEILSEINTIADVESKIKLHRFRGEIPDAYADALKRDIYRQLSTPIVLEWFSPNAKILNETSILQPDGEVSRPDRVVMHPNGKISVVDYKFGEENTSHKKQVLHYVSLIKRMGYFDVEGYIWYLSTCKIIRAI